RREIACGPRRIEREVTTHALIGRHDPRASHPPDITLADDAVSRRHARLIASADGYYLEDLESTNGTRINGRPLPAGAPVRLQAGDRVDLGEDSVIRVLPFQA